MVTLVVEMYDGTIRIVDFSTFFGAQERLLFQKGQKTLVLVKRCSLANWVDSVLTGAEDDQKRFVERVPNLLR